jgi:hypothetical protein
MGKKGSPLLHHRRPDPEDITFGILDIPADNVDRVKIFQNLKQKMKYKSRVIPLYRG